jgi:cytochrome c oxidase assembly factor CtaG
MLIMLLALQGPLHELSDYFLFSAHMVQHLLIMLVMPPFLLMGTPDWLIRPLLRLPGARQAAGLLTRPIAAFLYGVGPSDPLTYAAVAIGLTGVALLASYLPARRASRLEPSVALRTEL